MIMHCLQRYSSNKRTTMQNLQIPETADESKIVPNGSSHPASQIQTDLPPAAHTLCWLLQSLQKHKNNELLQGGGFLGVAGGN
jgi:hypothetical protein